VWIFVCCVYVYVYCVISLIYLLQSRSVKWDNVIDDKCVRGWNYAQGVMFTLVEETVVEMRLSCHRDVKVLVALLLLFHY
jgi:hypothetical protein